MQRDNQQFLDRIGRIIPCAACALTVIACGALTGFAQAPDSQRQAAPQRKPVDAAVGKILDEMEAAGQAIDTIRCDVKLAEKDNLNLTETTKYGSILFKRAKPHAMFMVTFDRTEADGIVHKDKEWWLFRDRWLTEAKSQSNTVIRREQLREGESIDLFDLEKTPFPMPFGQKRDQIERNFGVTLTAPTADDPDGCDHLVCRPHPDAPLAREYKRLDFLVSKDLHLPIRIIAEDVRGDSVRIADFPGLAKTGLNLDLPDKAFALPPETQDYGVSTESLE